jgi:hypothetical protein
MDIEMVEWVPAPTKTASEARESFSKHCAAEIPVYNFCMEH